MDMASSCLGFLEAHPPIPVVSLHHLLAFRSVLPGLTPMVALKKLALAMKLYPAGFLQQTVCRGKGFTLAVANGATVRLWEEEIMKQDLTIMAKTVTTTVTPNCDPEIEGTPEALCKKEANAGPWIFERDMRFPQEFMHL